MSDEYSAKSTVLTDWLTGWQTNWLTDWLTAAHRNSCLQVWRARGFILLIWLSFSITRRKYQSLITVENRVIIPFPFPSPLCLCLSFSVTLSVFFCLSFSVSLSIYVCLSAFLCLCFSLALSVCLSLFLVLFRFSPLCPLSHYIFPLVSLFFIHFFSLRYYVFISNSEIISCFINTLI